MRYKMMKHQASNGMKHWASDDERTSGQPSWEWAVWIAAPSPPAGDGDIIGPLGVGTGPLSLERRLPRVTASGWPIRDWSAPHGRDPHGTVETEAHEP